MKMGIGFFWGVILIAIGLSIIFKVMFGISIFRIIIAVVFILIGIKILMGRSNLNFSAKDSDVIFNERKYTEFPTGSIEYNTIFGKSVYDFKEASVPADSTIAIKFNTVFGHTQIYLPPGLPVKVKGEAVFGAVDLPNDNTAVFGSANYISEHDSAFSKFVEIEASAVFGHIEIRQRKEY
jgi:predicted membrane protein